MPADMTTLFETHDQKWAAVRSNNKYADGHFWYGVTSTGIVCRPNCPSRKPLRVNVQFYDSVSDAENAGFRRCKRCHP